MLLALRRALRTKSRRQKQARGLTVKLRDALIAACPHTPVGLRDQAMVAIGYDTLCRRSELASLRLEDLSRHDPGMVSILIRRAKNDPFGDGRIGYLSARTMKHLDAWLECAAIDSGWLFRRVRGNQVGSNAIHPYTVNRIIKSLATRAGLPPNTVRELSGHSMRVGAAQDMMTNGHGILPIMKAGGWKSINVVGRYVENAELQQLLQHGMRGEFWPAMAPMAAPVG